MTFVYIILFSFIIMIRGFFLLFYWHLQLAIFVSYIKEYARVQRIKSMAPSQNYIKNVIQEREDNEEKYVRGEIMDARFVESASEVKRCVGRITGPRKLSATGFRISKRLIMTCQHVSEDCTEDTVIQFHHCEPLLPNVPGKTVSTDMETFHLQPEKFRYEKPELDFAVIAIEEEPHESLSRAGIISHYSEAEEGKSLTNEHINIFSHPEGKPLRLSLRQNIAVEEPQKKVLVGIQSVPKARLWHQADTAKGSSGAPIFNDRWQLIGIHQGFGTVALESNTKVFYANYGTLIKHVLDDMYSKPGEGLTAFEEQLKENVKELGLPFANRKCTKNFKENCSLLDDVTPNPPVSVIDDDRVNDGCCCHF